MDIGKLFSSWTLQSVQSRAPTLCNHFLVHRRNHILKKLKANCFSDIAVSSDTITIICSGAADCDITKQKVEVSPWETIQNENRSHFTSPCQPIWFCYHFHDFVSSHPWSPQYLKTSPFRTQQNNRSRVEHDLNEEKNNPIGVWNNSHRANSLFFR